MIFLERSDDTSHRLNEKFGIEALVLPIQGIDAESVAFDTRNQRNKLVRKLVERGKRTIEGAHRFLSVIAEELTNRENRTCLLLPPKNFGKGMQQVYQCVNEAINNGTEAEELKRRIQAIGNQLPKRMRGKRRCFVGAKGLVFESPTKAGPRHAEVPDWEIRITTFRVFYVERLGLVFHTTRIFITTAIYHAGREGNSQAVMVK